MSTQIAEFRISDIEEGLNIKWEDVEDYDMCWSVLQLWMRDGRELEYRGGVWNAPLPQTPQRFTLEFELRMTNNDPPYVGAGLQELLVLRGVS